MRTSKKKTKTTNTYGKLFDISIEKKKKLLGLFMLLFSGFLFLSIISYSRTDEANLTYQFSDLFRVFSSDPAFVHKVESTNNWLGVFGAYVSGFFINKTLGYSSIIFPVMLFLWGYVIIRQEKYKLALDVSNFLLAIGVLVASFFGVLRFKLQILSDINELSGNAGNAIGMALGRLFGGLGSLFFLTTLVLAVLIIAFDIKLGKVVSLLNNIFQRLVEWFEEMRENSRIADENKQKEKAKTVSDNLSKVKELKEERSKKLRVTPAETEAAAETEDTDETTIRIVRKDEAPAMETAGGKNNPAKPKTFSLKSLKNKATADDSMDSPAADGAQPETGMSETADKKPEIRDEFDIPVIDKAAENLYPEQWNEEIEYNQPPLTLLQPAPEENFTVAEEELKRNAELLKEKLALFDIKIEDIAVTPGPVVTLYEIVPSPGVKISRIVSLEHDIALALAARGIRIIAPIPGKSAIGVEIPNAEAAMIHARSVLAKISEEKAELPLALGKTISGEIYVTDLAKMPHMLIAGSTGSGKSVGINMIISSILYAKHPSDVKFVIIDPKKIELSFYRKLNKHFLAVSPDLEEEIITNPQNAVLVLKSVEYEMEKRYNKLAKAGVRNIVDYNIKVADPKKKPKDTDDMQHYKMPYIVVIIDELADLMITASKEVEEPIARLAQLARAVGIHLVLATQRPSVNVITGVIKANFSARVAYQVATKIDSRTILDMNGAEQLLGRGDMLFLPSGTPKPIRIQNAFISTDEVEAVTDFIYSQKGYSKRYFLPSLYDKKKEAGGEFLADKDAMFEDAARVIVRHQQGSVSLLQRRLKLGYSRAARIVDQLEEAGIVGSADGSKVRAVLVEDEEQLETILRAL
ncbi:MAG: DNA translocase FtsK [Bacteroidota bacterium]